MAQSISIYSLYKSGAIDFVLNNGIKNVELTVEYCKIYEEYLKFRAQNLNYTQAVELTADKLCVTDRKVKRAIAMVL